MNPIDELNSMKQGLGTQLEVLKKRFHELFGEEFKTHIQVLVRLNLEASDSAMVRMLECGLLDDFRQQTAEICNAIDEPVRKLKSLTSSEFVWNCGYEPFYRMVVGEVEEIINETLRQFLKSNGIALTKYYSFQTMAAEPFKNTLSHCHNVAVEIINCQKTIDREESSALKRKIAASWPKTTE